MFTRESLQNAYNSGQKIAGNSVLGKYLKQQTSFLREPAFPKQRIWHILNNTIEPPSCKMCNNKVRWNNTAKTTEQAYRTYCSKSCQMNDPDYKAKKRATELNRYGKGRKQIVTKMRATSLQRYGVENAMQLEQTKKKQQTTVMARYCVENIIQLQNIQEKRKQTNMSKYGVEAPAQSSTIQEKMKQTYQSKYGVDHPSRIHIPREILDKLNNREWLRTEYIDNHKTIFEIATNLTVSPMCIYLYLQRHKFELRWQSVFEQEIVRYIKEIYEGKIVRNTRRLATPYEIDIFLPKEKLAIEFNGLYWHSELNGKNKTYHINKTTLCEAKNIRLLQIWENEWLFKQPIIKSKITGLLNKHTKIHARKCKVMELNNSRIFLEENHIQGPVHGAIQIGLLYNNMLVSVMVFSPSRMTTKYQYEMLRFCSKQNYTVVGGATKLHAYFVNQYTPESIISYCDLRYGVGSFYSKLGYEYSHRSKPNYWYFHNKNVRELNSRLKFQKHRLPQLLENFDPDLTEWENMVNNGYDRIWDCGNDVWIWTK